MKRIAFALGCIVLGLMGGMLATGIALAARNSSGTYSLPSGNPVVGGTAISSTWANNTLGDLAQGVTDSLDRQGRGGMLAPLRTPDGTVLAPGHSFTNETGTGLYRIGAADLGVSVNGTKRAEFTATGVSVVGTLGVSGTSTLDSLGVTGNASVNGTFAVTGGTTLSTVSTTGNAGVGGVLTVTGTTNMAGGLASNVNANGNTITGLATPSAATDAATKGYVDTRALNYSVSASSGNWSNSGATYAQIANASRTITTLGRPVIAMLQPDGSTTAGTLSNYGANVTSIRLQRDGTTIAIWAVDAAHTGQALVFLDAPAAGSHTYAMQAVSDGNHAILVGWMSLAVFEL